MYVPRWQDRPGTLRHGALGKTFQLIGCTIQYGSISHSAVEYVSGVCVCSGPSTEPTIQNQILSSQKIFIGIFTVAKVVTL